MAFAPCCAQSGPGPARFMLIWAPPPGWGAGLTPSEEWVSAILSPPPLPLSPSFPVLSASPRPPRTAPAEGPGLGGPVGLSPRPGCSLWLAPISAPAPRPLGKQQCPHWTAPSRTETNTNTNKPKFLATVAEAQGSSLQDQAGVSRLLQPHALPQHGHAPGLRQCPRLPCCRYQLADCDD